MRLLRSFMVFAVYVHFGRDRPVFALSAKISVEKSPSHQPAPVNAEETQARLWPISHCRRVRPGGRESRVLFGSLNLHLFSGFAALPGVFAVRKAEWLPGPDSNIRPIRLQPRSEVLCFQQ
jgi:hypothetical protein